jgi:hypothetical protein
MGAGFFFLAQRCAVCEAAHAGIAHGRGSATRRDGGSGSGVWGTALQQAVPIGTKYLLPVLGHRHVPHRATPARGARGAGALAVPAEVRAAMGEA